MGIRRRLGTALAVAALLAAAGCSEEEDAATATAEPTSDADCAGLVPDGVFSTLGWTPTAEGATSTVRGCHREAEQGYVEARRRSAAQYERLCATLDRTGDPSPGLPAPWLGEALTACAVEPSADVGTTTVLVRTDDEMWQLAVVALTATPQEQVRAALVALLAAVTA